jgi:hypothetical protein
MVDIPLTAPDTVVIKRCKVVRELKPDEIWDVGVFDEE